MKKPLLISICFALTFIINAQTIDKRWNVGLHGGLFQYRGDLGSDFYNTNKKFYGMGGISFSRYIANNFDINLFVTKGTIGFNSSLGSFRREISTATMNFRFNILGPQYVVRPYLFVGGGVALFDKNFNVTERKVDYMAPSFGGGANFKLSPSVMLNLQETFFNSSGDIRDGIAIDGNDMFLFHSLGITFNFGTTKDADKDGISDYLDKCPDTPEKIAVNKNGCPNDKDADGVADYLDACPDLAGDAALFGCPDKDNDGIADKDDDCPDVKGLKELKGCSDEDSDGIIDTEDRCPGLAGIVELEGCPDTDNDGVADLDDICPNTIAGYMVDVKGCTMDNDKDGLVNEDDDCPDLSGVLALKGCPDSDGDGISDKEDRCPFVKGAFSNKGCPEMTAADVKKITNIASKIFFETNSDQLKVASLAQLDELAIILKKYEAANLLIEGHADSQGDDAFNLTLSQKRTESVKEYLMEQGILESRLTAIGYGETRPIAENTTELGRAKNRRVVLITSY